MNSRPLVKFKMQYMLMFAECSIKDNSLTYCQGGGHGEKKFFKFINALNSPS